METIPNSAGLRAARREEWRRILADLDTSGERASACGRDRDQQDGPYLHIGHFESGIFNDALR